jgi:hypothetical protein
MSDDTPQAPPHCPWCPYIGTLKQVLRHMEAAHRRRWCDLARCPPLAGGMYQRGHQRCAVAGPAVGHPRAPGQSRSA